MWYGVTDETRCTFAFDAALDRAFYSLEHYIGTPILEYNSSSKTYHLTNPAETLAALDAALLQTAPAKPGGKRSRAEITEMHEQKRQRQGARWDEAQATTTKADRAARAARMSASARKK